MTSMAFIYSLLQAQTLRVRLKRNEIEFIATETT